MGPPSYTIIGFVVEGDVVMRRILVIFSGYDLLT
jgi:hypothetical protein